MRSNRNSRSGQAKVKRYKLTVTLSGSQGEVMRMEKAPPFSMWARFQEICKEADEHNKVYDMTLAKRTRADIARTLGRSATWVIARQKDMGLLQEAHTRRKKFSP